MLDHIREQSTFDETAVQIGEAYLAHRNSNNDVALQILNDMLNQRDRTHRAELLFMKGLLHLDMNEEAMKTEPPLWLAVRINEHL